MLNITRLFPSLKLLSMTYSRLPVYSFTIVKAQLRVKQIADQSQRIALFMKIDVPKNATPLQIHNKFIQFITKHHAFRRFNDKQIMEFVSVQPQLKIIQFIKQAIAKEFKDMKGPAQIAIDNLYNFCSAILLHIDRQLIRKQGNSPAKQSPNSRLPISAITQIALTINQIFPLISLNLPMYVKYTNNLVIYSKLGQIVPSGQYIPNLRVCLDQLSKMDIKLFDQKSRVFLFKNIAHIPLTILYYQKSLQIYQHFWQGVKNIWHRDFSTRLSFYHALKNVNFVTDDIIDKTEQALTAYTKRTGSKFTEQQINETSKLLNNLIRYKRINRNNYDKYRSLVAKILEINKNRLDEFFKYLVQAFYMTGIWMAEFWLPFMENLKTSKGRQMQFYQLYVLSRLFELQKQQISAQIHKASKALFELIAQNQKYKKIQELIKDYNQKQVTHKTVACQTQLANALRILNTGSVRTEHYIKVFCVDIIVDDEFIIEVNGNMHMLNNIDKGTKQYNIKTQFRSRLLNKLGYHVIDVDLDEYAQASFKLIETINQIIAKLRGNPKKQHILLSLKS